jgi:hypothetical protein
MLVKLTLGKKEKNSSAKLIALMQSYLNEFLFLLPSVTFLFIEAKNHGAKKMLQF